MAVASKPNHHGVVVLDALYNAAAPIGPSEAHLRESEAHLTPELEALITRKTRNTAPTVLFLAPVCSATAGGALARRPFVGRVGNRRVTDDFVSPATSPATLGGLSKVYPNALAGARGGAGGFSCPHTSAHDQGRHPPSTVCQSDV